MALPWSSDDRRVGKVAADPSGRDSATLRAHHAPSLAAFRDGVLDRADLESGDVLLDVGCGTGLIGFGALDRLGPHGRVIFSDVSPDLLEECRRTAGGDQRCSFVRASADELAGVADGCVDVVTTRSVLIYSDRKAAALAEFYRVLRPGGRLSLFETNTLRRIMLCDDRSAHVSVRRRTPKVGSDAYLPPMVWTPIVRHRKVIGGASVDDPATPAPA
jgi:SAM-dependent methyltransferase